MIFAYRSGQGIPRLLTKLARYSARIAADIETVLGLEQPQNQRVEQF